MAWVRPPEVPVMVTVVVPRMAKLLAARVSRLVLVVAEELSEAVTPAGTPAMDKLTRPLNPARGNAERMVVPVLPGMRLNPIWEAYRVKSLVPVPARKLIRLIPLGVPQPVHRS